MLPPYHSTSAGVLCGFSGILAAGMLLAICACSSTPASLPPTADGTREHAVFKQVMKALTRKGGAAGLDFDVLEAQTLRFDQITAWHLAGELESASQRFWAGAALVRSDDPQHLMRAETLGSSAATLGEPRGHLVEAEARDKMALLLGEPQPFGTQSVFHTLAGEWRLYEVNPRTTDAQRAAMGLPTLEELARQAEARNQGAFTERLRDEILRPSGLPR